jgi:hypothetical protein
MSVFVHEQTLDEFREKRKQMVENNCTLTHWSTELVLQSKILSRKSLQIVFHFLFLVGVQTDLPKITLDKFNHYQKALIFGF